MPIDKETEYKALKACLSGEAPCSSCKLDECPEDSGMVYRLLELHGEMVARKIAERMIVSASGTSLMLDIAKSVGKE